MGWRWEGQSGDTAARHTHSPSLRGLAKAMIALVYQEWPESPVWGREVGRVCELLPQGRDRRLPFLLPTPQGWTLR